MTTKTTRKKAWTPEEGADLKRRREAAGVSRYLVGKTLGYQPPQVDGWESGARQPSAFELSEIERLIVEAATAPPRVPTTPWGLADRFDGGRLRTLRTGAGYGRVKFAHRLGTSEPRVWAWEKGRSTPGQYYADKICDALGVDPEDLCRPARVG